MHVNEMKQSAYLKKEDVGAGALCTVKGDVFQENMAKEGAPEDLKWCVQFDEFDKPMVLNSTNAQAIAKIAGNEDTAHWAGVKVVLYNDPNVGYAGKITGGIRIRAPRNPSAAKPAAPAAKPSPIDAEDAPF